MHVHRSIAMLLAAATLTIPATLAPSANADERVTTTSWSPLTTGGSPNFAQASVTRTADGTQHVVWMVDNPDHTHHYEHTTISPAGVQGPVNRVLATNWSQLSSRAELGVNADGTLRIAFRGSIDGSTADFFSYKGVYTAISADGGTTWALPREVLAKSITIGDLALAYTPDGTPIAGYGDTGGFHWNVGAIPESGIATATIQEFTDHDAVAASLISSGGVVYVVYQSSRVNGIFARQVWPTLGAPIQAPGGYTNPGQPMSVVDRPGVGPVAAYKLGAKVVLWDILANATHEVRGMDGPNNVELAALPDGHLWVAAQGPIGYTPRASRVAASGWNIDRSPAMLDELYTTFGLEVTSVGALRAELIVTGNASGEPTRMQAMSVLAQLSVKASPHRWRVGRTQRVGFLVTDVDGAVAGAKVRAGGKQCTTNGSGKCKIVFRPVNRPKKFKAKASKSSYIAAQTVLRVKR